jgi:Fe-S cluster assembly protein SufD
VSEVVAQSPSALADAVKRLAGDDPAWLAASRHDAWARFESLALPSRVEHLWRYTDPAELLPGERAPQTPETQFGDLPDDFHDGTYENAAAYAICRDGALLRSTVDKQITVPGLVIADLRDAARRHEALVRPRLFSLATTCDAAGAKFDALSGALFAGGAFVHVPAKAELDLPIRVAHRVGGSGLVATRSLFVVGAHAKATIVLDLTSAHEDDAPMLHETLEVFVGAGASLRLAVVQGFSRRTVHAPIVHARVERDARFETIAVALGGAVTKSLQTTVLAESGASSKVQGIVFADRRGHFDHHTFMDHVAPHTTSELDYRTVVADRARSAFTGRLRIAKGGVGADARQRNHNMLLSEHARADTIPELEILTDDVKCSHAAAVGPIDEEQVYFCTSRGLTPSEARQTIVTGFLEPAVAGIPGENLQKRVRDALDARLAGMR